MKQSSLDSEPPTGFRGEKEVSKRKNKNLPHMIFSVKNEKPRDKSNLSAKTLEKKTKGDIHEYTLEQEYLNANEKQSTSISNKTNYIAFNRTSTFSEDQIERNFRYEILKKSIFSTKERDLKFYEIDSSYSFSSSQTPMKEYDIKEKYQSESKEKEENETFYALRSFEEEQKIEEDTIKWNAMSYN